MDIQYRGRTELSLSELGVRPGGRVSDDMTVGWSRDDARRTALNILAHLHTFLGGLDRVRRTVKVFFGMGGDPGLRPSA